MICYKDPLRLTADLRTWDENVATAIENGLHRKDKRKPQFVQEKIIKGSHSYHHELENFNERSLSWLQPCRPRWRSVRLHLSASDSSSLKTQLGGQSMIQSDQPQQPIQMNLSRSFKLRMGSADMPLSIDTEYIRSWLEVFCWPWRVEEARAELFDTADSMR